MGPHLHVHFKWRNPKRRTKEEQDGSFGGASDFKDFLGEHPYVTHKELTGQWPVLAEQSTCRWYRQGRIPEADLSEAERQILRNNETAAGYMNAHVTGEPCPHMQALVADIPVSAAPYTDAPVLTDFDKQTVTLDPTKTYALVGHDAVVAADARPALGLPVQHGPFWWQIEGPTVKMGEKIVTDKQSKKTKEDITDPIIGWVPVPAVTAVEDKDIKHLVSTGKVRVCAARSFPCRQERRGRGDSCSGQVCGGR